MHILPYNHVAGTSNFPRGYSRIEVSASGNALEVRLWEKHAMGQEPVAFLFDLDRARSERGFYDGAVFGLRVTGNAVPLRGRTLNNRENIYTYAYSLGFPEVCCAVFIPDTGASLDECVVVLLLDDQTEYDTALGPAILRIANLAPVLLASMPEYVIRGDAQAQAGDLATIHISARLDGKAYPRPLSVYLDSVNGLLPKTKLMILPGQESPARVITTGLDPGDEVKVKAGFRNYPGRTEHLIRIVEKI